MVLVVEKKKDKLFISDMSNFCSTAVINVIISSVE